MRHLHDFAREVRLTEAEWFRAVEFLTRCGHITDDKRQEFILLSDVLGLSMLTVAMNNDKPPGCTEATVFGPYCGAPYWNPRAIGAAQREDIRRLLLNAFDGVRPE